MAGKLAAAIMHPNAATLTLVAQTEIGSGIPRNCAKVGVLNEVLIPLIQGIHSEFDNEDEILKALS